MANNMMSNTIRFGIVSMAAGIVMAFDGLSS
jgi:hypothetical protein